MSVLVEHFTETIAHNNQPFKCDPHCPRCAQDKLVELIRQKRDEWEKAIKVAPDYYSASILLGKAEAASYFLKEMGAE